MNVLITLSIWCVSCAAIFGWLVLFPTVGVLYLLGFLS